MNPKLTAKEETLMKIFWAHGPLFIRDLIAYLPDPKPHYNSVATLVKFMEDKGFLEREPMANSFRYKGLITEQQYQQDAVSEVVARYYGNSYFQMISQFAKEDKIDVQQLKDLISLIEKNKK